MVTAVILNNNPQQSEDPQELPPQPGQHQHLTSTTSSHTVV